jgi:hypothetical protein
VGAGGQACPKFSGPTLREERRERKATRLSQEKAAKAEAKRLDGGRCRWPHCVCKGKEGTERAHLTAKGMGGTPDGSRNDPRNLISICHDIHRGPRSLHSGDRKIVPLTDDGARGPCEFWQRDERNDWFLVAREREPHIFERD